MNNEKFDMDVVNEFFRHDYHDRGMMKWAGFYLSDHTQAMKVQQKVTQNRLNNKLEPQQSLEQIGEVLAQAFNHNQAVIIQLNELQDGLPVASLSGKIMGCTDTKVVLEANQRAALNDIRHVAIGENYGYPS